jgi:hypothetical protein
LRASNAHAAATPSSETTASSASLILGASSISPPATPTPPSAPAQPVPSEGSSAKDCCMPGLGWYDIYVHIYANAMRIIYIYIHVHVWGYMPIRVRDTFVYSNHSVYWYSISLYHCKYVIHIYNIYIYQHVYSWYTIFIYRYIYIDTCAYVVGWYVFLTFISIYLHIDTDPCGVMLYLFLFGFTCVLVHSFNICVFLKDPVCIPCG